MKFRLLACPRTLTSRDEVRYVRYPTRVPDRARARARARASERARKEARVERHQDLLNPLKFASLLFWSGH